MGFATMKVAEQTLRLRYHKHARACFLLRDCGCINCEKSCNRQVAGVQLKGSPDEFGKLDIPREPVAFIWSLLWKSVSASCLSALARLTSTLASSNETLQHRKLQRGKQGIQEDERAILRSQVLIRCQNSPKD